MDSFDPNKCLSPHLVIKGVDDILYEYGMSLYSVSEDTKRSRIYSPKLIFILSIVELMKSIAILMTDDNDILRLQILDFGICFNFKIIWNYIIVLGCVQIISMQMLNYISKREGLKNEHYAILGMMAGRQSPSSFGIIKYKDV